MGKYTKYIPLFIILIILAFFAYVMFNYMCIGCHEEYYPACSFSMPEFSCRAFKLSANDSSQSGLTLDLFQTTGHNIRIIGANCTTSYNATANDFEAADYITINNTEHAFIRGTYANPLPIPCWKSDGTTVSSRDIGTTYQGGIYIRYIELDSNFTHIVYGVITGKVE